MTSPTEGRSNVFLTAPLPILMARTAAPLVLVMSMNGLLTVIDAIFIGEYVGSQALAAVTLMFPLYMLLAALSTLVASGMASVLARRLGAADIEGARKTFVGAHGLALLVCLGLIALFQFSGSGVIAWMANGSAPLAATAYDYISVLVWASPVLFVLSINGDGLRCEGRLGFMAGVSMLTSAANIGFNYLLIATLQWGVAGSAVGTVLAQSTALAIVVVFRFYGATPLRLPALPLHRWRHGWSQFLALGAPQSLSFIGISLTSTAVIYALQVWARDGYADIVAAYGIMTRILTFAFLPLLGLNMATQTIVGNNFGASRWSRTDAGLRSGLTVALLYCATVQALLFATSSHVGNLFTDEGKVTIELARLLPIATMMYVLAGPIMVLSGYFQAIGDARRAAMLSIGRTYLFAIPLTLCLPLAAGEAGIWYASPTSEILITLVAAAILIRERARTGLRWGVFRASGLATD